MKLPRKLQRQRRWVEAGILITACLLMVGGLAYQASNTKPGGAEVDSRAARRIARQSLDNDFYHFAPDIRRLVDAENINHITVVDDQSLQQQISRMRFDTAAGNYRQARQEFIQLKADVRRYQQDLNTAIAKREADAQAAKKQAAAPVYVPGPPPGPSVPIIIYHYTPGDFESQLQYLIAHGYTTITPDQLAAALTGHGGLPAKPIILTFDDGFSDQLRAFGLLQKYNMKATFYIIAGGPGSNYCVGANRTNTTCGDAYMTWDQIVMLDQSGLITIGDHTVDHANLASLNPETQRYEIVEAKNQIEAHLGHPITTFAYPYGAYNGTTISLIQQAGFTTAVTTLPGTIQTAGRLLTLYRARVVYALP